MIVGAGPGLTGGRLSLLVFSFQYSGNNQTPQSWAEFKAYRSHRGVKLEISFEVAASSNNSRVMQNLGENFDLNDDAQILAINSPTSRVGGPYVVVAKSVEERWAIVALDWDNDPTPTLGIRQFWGAAGSPFVRDFHAIWFILPERTHFALLAGLGIDLEFQTNIQRFLLRQITGEQLAELAAQGERAAN